MWGACQIPWKGGKHSGGLKWKTMGFFKRSIALRKRNPFGRQSGVSPLFLTAFPVQAPVSVYYLTITFNSKESDNILIKKGDLLLIIDVKTDNKVITLGKNVPPIKTSLPWKTPLPKTSVLSRKFAKKLSRSSSKERLPRQWKARKVAFWGYFFKCTSELGKHLLATISIYYGNKIKSIPI